MRKPDFFQNKANSYQKAYKNYSKFNKVLLTENIIS